MRRTKFRPAADTPLSPADVKMCGRVKVLRSQLGLSQAQFAEALQISTSYVKGIETARNAPTVAILRQINKLYRTSYDFLIDGS